MAAVKAEQKAAAVEARAAAAAERAEAQEAAVDAAAAERAAERAADPNSYQEEEEGGGYEEEAESPLDSLGQFAATFSPETLGRTVREWVGGAADSFEDILPRDPAAEAEEERRAAAMEVDEKRLMMALVRAKSPRSGRAETAQLLRAVEEAAAAGVSG